MSDLQRKWARAKFTAMATPNDLHREGVRDEEDTLAALPGEGGHEYPIDDDSSSASSMSSTGTIVPSPSRSLFARPQGVAPGRSLEQIPWTMYFERELFLQPESVGDGSSSITYHAYLTSPAGKGPLFVTHHGAGSSGLSFAVLSSEIRKRLPSAGILSLDARGHGATQITTANGPNTNPTTPSQPPLDLSLPTLANDLLTVLELTKQRMKWPDLPPIVLVGHSLGGAVVTEVARGGTLGATLLAYAVLDVVEGSAMDALQSMTAYLSTRPAGFASVREAIEWHVRSRTIRNSVSARTSVPGLLVFEGDGEDGKATSGTNGEETLADGDKMDVDYSIQEEGGEVEGVSAMRKTPARTSGGGNGGSSSKRRPWRWRTDLAATQPFWEGWFVGLSKKFLEAKGGKMLLLAGTDRLDTELTIGQMQGKYALQVFPEAGHFIHEDLPEKTAMALVDFYRRNDRSSLMLPPKVSELLAQGRKV